MSSKKCAPRGVCIPNEPDGFEPPQPFWIGPHDEAKLTCPDDVGSFGALAYADLQPPHSSGCPVCVCGPIEGSCSPTPGQIHIRAGSCNEAQTPTIEFGAPASWDGSCTNAGALPAGAECPPGSGILCAQSVYVSALPDPVEGCKPEPLPIPSATNDAPWWGQVALSCSASPPAPPWTCEADTSCQWELPPGFRHCVRREGVHACVDGSPYAERFVVHPYDAIKDSRGCSPCECKASGGMCYGTFRLYEDSVCSSEILADPMGSTSHECDDILPPGRPVGSKEITDLQYMPGKCQPSGGGAFGTVELDDAGAVTWCCMAPAKAPAE
ncbi:hypothetical protein [Polyangium sp. y55x31]|uniref:hypothetical protein n=1 Tax=Polyangium sp. y55x31 TaxID=3042688 RepID=UPI002482C899|nr:hypothetical protein [Polyangium sp. y55x31]MDI1475391.1 hypothetical protein [Polyangium sp. y55x31]